VGDPPLRRDGIGNPTCYQNATILPWPSRPKLISERLPCLRKPPQIKGISWRSAWDKESPEIAKNGLAVMRSGVRSPTATQMITICFVCSYRVMALARKTPCFRAFVVLWDGFVVGGDSLFRDSPGQVDEYLCWPVRQYHLDGGSGSLPDIFSSPDRNKMTPQGKRGRFDFVL